MPIDALRLLSPKLLSIRNRIMINISEVWRVCRLGRNWGLGMVAHSSCP